jgi:hypothetical protein
LHKRSANCEQCFPFWAKFHQISTVKNIISTYTKDFEQKKMAKIRQISKEKKEKISKSPDFYNKWFTNGLLRTKGKLIQARLRRRKQQIAI